MKKLSVSLLTCALLTAGLTLAPFDVRASEADHEISYDEVASDSEKAAVEEVGIEGMYPIYGSDIEDGTYEVEVESSSSMFQIESAELTVSDGEMTAVMTMGGTGYLKLFMGTGEEAAAADPSEYIDFVENADGKHTFTVPVEALDAPVACAAFSKNKEKWYDRSLLFRADSLPSEAVLTELPDYEALEKAAKEKRIAAMKAKKEQKETPEEDSPDGEEAAPSPVQLDMEDGEYAIAVDLEGGTGRTTITSPAVLLVQDGFAFAQIEWSSSSYDYMKVGGQQYLPISEEGYSTFEIPITAMDEPVAVIADTTAMSTPHEIEYALTFHSDGITPKGQTPQAAAQKVVYVVIAIVAVCVVVSVIQKRKRR